MSPEGAGETVRRVRARDLVCTFADDGALLLRSWSLGVAGRAPPFAAALLSFCSQARSREDVVATMGPAAAGLFDGLVDAGFLLDPEAAEETPVLFAAYAGINIHRRMLGDEPRIQAYAAAIAAVVRPGDVVVDAGSGTGILAVLAARAGAARVYAIERTDFAEVIPRVAADSGVGERVSVLRGDIATVQAPEKARVLVSETLGMLALDEGGFPDVAACAARNLLPDGVCLPRAVDLWMAPLRRLPDELLHPFRLREEGVDLRSLLPSAKGRGLATLVRAEDCGTPRHIARVPFPGDDRFSGSLTLDEACEALVAWFAVDLCDGVRLSTGPTFPPTHWKQTVLPVRLRPGEHEVAGGPAPEDRRTLLLELGGQPVRVA